MRRGLISYLMLSALAHRHLGEPRRPVLVVDDCDPPRAQQPPADLERIAAAQAKRDRKAAKRAGR